jgi:SAM-dependent methyltransferase
MTRERYLSTRRAWQAIWRHQADAESELRTLGYPRARQTTSLYLSHLPKQGLILEAGCGLGKEVIQLSDLGYKVIGLDYIEEPLHKIRAHRGDSRLTAADIHALPFRDESLDAYLSFGVLEHFDFGPAPALREAWRVLRKGGLLVLSVPYPSLVWRLTRVKKRLALRAGGKEANAYYETTYRMTELELFLRIVGFEVIARYPTSHSFALWGIGRLFRGRDYYETSPLAEFLGSVFARLLPWSMCFASLLIAHKKARGDE